MSTEPSSAREEPSAAASPSRAELLGYAVLAIVLFALLWRRVGAADAFYLDEWVYVHGGEYIWGNLPQALWGTIPEWNRGTQRLYSLLIGLPWTVLGSGTAYTLTHLLNVGLLVSAIVPAALIARRVSDRPWLRLLGVALAVAVPWLAIGLHLLTENLGFPLYLWVCWAAIRAGEAPSARRWLLAIVLVAALTLVRTNYAVAFALLLAAAVAGEVARRRDPREGSVLGGLLRRHWLLLAATALAVVVGLRVLSGSSTGSFGVYGNFGVGDTLDRLFGDGARATRQTALTYAKSLVQGGFVFPFVLGTAVALAALFGRLGRRLAIPAVVAVTGMVAVVASTAAWTAGAALEDRYVFVAYAPLVLLAPAAIAAAARLRGWLVVAALAALWALVTGTSAAAVNSGNFFAAPGGAFWNRVLEARLRAAEGRFLGWTLLPPTGWLLVALALAALVAVVALLRHRPRALTAVLGGGLALCVVAQLASTNYVLGQELYGTTDAPGGVALQPGHAVDRETWVDDAVPDGQAAAIVPGVAGVLTPYGATEVIQFWSRDVDQTINIDWNGTAPSTPPGSTAIPAPPGADGVATIEGTPRRYLVAWRDDPRVQFPGRQLAASPNTPYALFALAGRRAAWTATGVDGDGAVLQDRPATLTLDRRAAPDVRAVTVRFTTPATRPARWTVRRGSRRVAGGRLRPGAAPGEVRLTVPRCGRGACDPVQWTLTAGSREPAALPFPGGAPDQLRPVVLSLTAATLEPAP